MYKFAKRVIWFFGFPLFFNLDYLLIYLMTHTQPENYMDDWRIQLLTLSVWLLPLLFMKDDKHNGGK